MESQFIIAHVDKTVLRISGLEIKGMNTRQLEEILSHRLKSFARVIGVTGEHIEMDVYNLDPEKIQKDANGVIQAIALADGITLTDLTKVSCNEKIKDVAFSEIPEEHISDCPRERWIDRG